jgi:hypothetical protein
MHELFSDALKHLMLFWRLRNGMKTLNYFCEKGNYKNLRENPVGGFIPDPDSVMNIRATTNNFISGKRTARKTQSLLHHLNLALTRTLPASVLPGPARPGRARTYSSKGIYYQCVVLN